MEALAAFAAVSGSFWQVLAVSAASTYQSQVVHELLAHGRPLCMPCPPPSPFPSHPLKLLFQGRDAISLSRVPMTFFTLMSALHCAKQALAVDDTHQSG